LGRLLACCRFATGAAREVDKGAVPQCLTLFLRA
jgi:hypothetical protein